MEKFDYSKQPGRARIRTYSPDPSEALVSIITPFYNAGKYFEQTFNSVMNQTFPWFEWIIVDDGSTNTEDLELLDYFAQKDGRIKLIHQQNGGLSCARNTGVRNSNTDLVVPLDADDILEPQYIECTYFCMMYHPEAAWCYTSTHGFQAEEYEWHYPFDAEKLKTYNYLNYIGMIRKKDIEEVGGWKVEKWSYFEDWRFWLDMLALHKRPVHVDTCLFWYRRLDTGMLSTIRKDQERVAFSERIIREAAAKADGSVQGIEYPCAFSQEQYYTPRVIPWDRLSCPEYRMPKVLWLIPWMEMGGADKFNLDAIAGLTQCGYKNCILTTVRGENGWRQRFEEYTDEIFCLPDFLDPAHYLEFISYYIQSRGIDVLMVTNSYDGYYMIPWLRANFPELVIVDYVHMEEWYWKQGGYARTSSFVGGITERTWVCNSVTRQVMIENFNRSPESVACLYIGVDDQKFEPGRVKPGFLHEMLQIATERPIVLFPCRIHPQKRPFMMLEIARGVRERCPEAAFVVVGDGPQLEEMKQRAAAEGLSGTVYFAGRCEKMRECYRDSAVTLICSLKEGLSLTAYESCAMGVPVVSGDVGGQKDLIDSEVGALVPLRQSESAALDARQFDENEVAQFVDELVRILSSSELRRTLGRNARRRIEAGFSLKTMVQKLDEELSFLCTNLEAREKRQKTARQLNATPGLADELYKVYLQLQRKEYECDEVWKARCWFMEHYENSCGELEQLRREDEERRCEYAEQLVSAEKMRQSCIAKDNQIEALQQQLDGIYAMRSWKAIEKYHRFVNDTSVGRWIRKAARGLYRVVKGRK